MSIRTFFGLIGLCFSENRRKTTSEKKRYVFFFLFRDYVWDCRRWIFSAKRFNWHVKLGVDRHSASDHFHLGNCSRIRSIVFSATPRSYEPRQVSCIICVLVILKLYQWYVYLDIASPWKPFIGLLSLSDIHWVCEVKLGICSCLVCVYRVCTREIWRAQKSVRVAWGAAERNSCFLNALQTSQVPP